MTFLEICEELYSVIIGFNQFFQVKVEAHLTYNLPVKSSPIFASS